MAQTTAVPAEPMLKATTMADAFRRTAAAHPDLDAFRTLDGSVSLTWSEARERADRIAAGLAGLGVGRGDTVALMLGNRPEFHLVDLAVMTLGGVPFSIYATSAPAQIEYVVADAGARVAVVEEQFLDRVRAAREHLPALKHLVVLEGARGPGTVGLDELERSGAPDFDGDAAAREVQPDDLLTLIYTSGTTGPPKGVQLSHRNLLTGIRAIETSVGLPAGSRVISWLPSAHIAERGAHHYIPIAYACTVTSCPDPRQIIAVLPQVRPTWYFAVPRIWEKLKAGLEAMIAAQPPEQREAADKALEAAKQKVRLEQAGEPVPDALAQAVARADAAMFAKLREQLGLDQVRAVNVGAAPTPYEVLEFFHAIGIRISELWGMSETCGAGTVNPPDAIRIGTVGLPSPGVEVRLAEDGELLMRSDCVMVGYRNQPDKTAEAIDADGWLHTGDIAEIDADGYVKLVDRKKELIINAAGKNMSPANIEAQVKGASPLIANAVCIGDARSYNTALIVLDADFAPAWATQQGIEERSLEGLAQDPRVRAAVQEAVDAANEKLARVEQIKRFTIVRGDWAPGGEELTPTMKLKRKPIAEKYAAEIEEMYAG